MNSTDDTAAGKRGASAHDYWAAVPLALSPELAALRMDVLAHSERRMPHWKLRLADDLVLDLQPRPGQRMLFIGQAVEASGVTAAAFEERGLRVLPVPYFKFGFEVQHAADGPLLKPKSIRWKLGNMTPADGKEALLRLRRRLVAAIEGLGEPATLPLLSNNCIICGKGLSDPVSQARRIGSECWGGLSPASRARAGVTTIEYALL